MAFRKLCSWHLAFCTDRGLGKRLRVHIHTQMCSPNFPHTHVWMSCSSWLVLLLPSPVASLLEESDKITREIWALDQWPVQLKGDPQDQQNFDGKDTNTTLQRWLWRAWTIPLDGWKSDFLHCLFCSSSFDLMPFKILSLIRFILHRWLLVSAKTTLTLHVWFRKYLLRP